MTGETGVLKWQNNRSLQLRDLPLLKATVSLWPKLLHELRSGIILA